VSWLQQLIETYDTCLGADQFVTHPLPPISHTPQQAHIEIVLDGQGNFKRAAFVQKEETLIPATEDSAGRSGSTIAPHPLCDKIQYVAADYVAYGGSKKKKTDGSSSSFYAEYLEQLSSWCASSFTHPKAQAVLSYVQKGSVVSDLVREQILHVDGRGKLLNAWEDTGEKPRIFRLIVEDQGDAFVRWTVETPGDLVPNVWRDIGLQEAWINYNASKQKRAGLCMATGSPRVALADNHPKRLRHSGDGARLISSNDDLGFTFRGRFTDKTGDQACGVGFTASQKAHLALRWLIQRQAYRKGDPTVVAWSIIGREIPDPLGDTASLFGPSTETVDPSYRSDAGQGYALGLRKKIAGYRAHLSADTSIVILALDAATPGRMAITFYRELGGDEFLNRIEAWHSRLAWRQNYGKALHFIGAPAPRDVAQAAYGVKVDDGLRKACVERLLPCISDGRSIPRDLVESTVRRAAQRTGMESWEWEKTLGIACSLFKGYYSGRDYNMSLEPDRTTRDYLYGRLLAVADRMEGRALEIAGERRDTTAMRLMHRFSSHPYSTWRTIELALQPYKLRLKSKTPGTLNWLEQQIDQICGQFQASDFMADGKLSGEFLLGFHCQRARLYAWKPVNPGTNEAPEEE